MALFGKRHVVAQVTGLTWSRVVQLERRQWDQKRGMFVPSGETRNVQKHTEQFWATVTDMIPGTPDANGIPGPPTPVPRQELQTRVYFTYEVLQWHKGRTLTAEGTDPSAVAWPDYPPDPPDPAERVRSKTEGYQVTFAAGDKQYETALPEAEWRDLEPGGSYDLSVGFFGGIKKITPARP
jgi:hypothetical protein